MGKSRLILSLNGIIMMIIGSCFFILNQKITLTMFPTIESNPQATEVAMILRYLMGSGLFTIGIILFLARKSVKSTAKSLLLGSSIGFFLIFCTTLFIVYNYENVNIPIVGIIVFPILSFISLFVSTRQFQE